MRPFSLFGLGVLLAACDLFPPELLPDASVADGGPGNRIVLAETCLSGDIPEVFSGTSNASIDLTSLSDHFRDLAACTGAATPGADGFFRVEMEAGQKWHFHVSVPSGVAVDPAIYVLDSCDDRRCQPGDGVDVCGDEQDEHLSFVAPRDGTFFVGIDGREAGGAVYQLLAVAPVCGNGGAPEHSETCEDGNTEDGDGCDSRCRAELGGATTGEVEPNDDPTGANALITPLAVDGVIGGRCDTDFYALAHPGGALSATLFAVGGVDCNPDNTPVLELDLLATDGVTVRAAGSPVDPNACPSLTRTDLAAGDYLLRIRAPADAPRFNYVLDVR